MICPVCGNNQWEFIRRYNDPDKYEQWAGILPPLCRRWYRCEVCELRKARHSYDLERLSHVYTNGYRAKNFRGNTIEDEFHTVVALPENRSENKQRIKWLSQFTAQGEEFLDVGAGLGVFLFELLLGSKLIGKAVEPNKDSANFIRTLGIECRYGFYRPFMFDQKFNWVSCVHVLEHQEHPEDMLLSFKSDLKPGGRVFIEVPDAREFETLPEKHDEFNSMHLHFFTPACLYRLLDGCGYRVADMRMVHTQERGLDRIMVVAHANY